MTNKILIVDNDELQCKSAEMVIVSRLGCQTKILTGGNEAINYLLSPQGQNIDLVLLDLSMPETDGIDVLRAVKPILPDLPIIIYTAYGDVEKAVEALRLGAVDFIEKKDGPERMKVSIENALKLGTLEKEVKRLGRKNTGHVDFADIIGSSDAINEAKKLAMKAAKSNIPVLLQGESGVGKELFARAIHGSSLREGEAFIAVNCGAIPENLVESVLFGHEKGSFTGAIKSTLGKFREASGGTLFLDEVGELKPDIQVKLLRILQQGEVEPVGSAQTISVNVRVISATNRTLKDEVACGNFREDLFYRLNVFPLTVPPLNVRSNDVTDIMDHFCKRISLHENKIIKGISDEAKDLLKKYPWPGNVRQLENVIYRAVVLSNNEYLGVKDFASTAEMSSSNVANGNDAICADSNISLLNDEGNFRNLHELEGEIILAALEHCNWHISNVSKILNIGRSTLYRKMQELGISPANKNSGN